MREIWYGTGFDEEDLRVVRDSVGVLTGMGMPGVWFFANAFFKWRGAGGVVGVRNGGKKAGELDPFRWRVEHWYGICGVESNWGCFHAMNTSGWGGVWERQRGMAEKMRFRIDADESGSGSESES